MKKQSDVERADSQLAAAAEALEARWCVHCYANECICKGKSAWCPVSIDTPAGGMKVAALMVAVRARRAVLAARKAGAKKGEKG